MASSIPSYILRFYPKPLPEDVTFKSLVEAIPPGKFYLLAPITVPFSPLPQKFILHTDAWANVITISVNDKVQSRLIPLDAGRIFSADDDPQGFHMEVEIGIILDHGVNNIHLEIDTGQTADLLVVSSTIASLYRGYSQTLFDDLLYPLQKENDSLTSPWSPQLMESLLRFRELLPDLRIPKTHAIKLAVRAMMAHSGTNLGVQAFATALAYNNPFIVNDDIAVDDFLKLDFNLKLWQDVVSGSDFHLWLPSKAAVGWMAFARLIKNLTRVWKDHQITEEEIIVENLLAQNKIEIHSFPDIIGPDFYEIIKELPRMKLGVSVERRTTRCFGLYNYRYPLGLKVLNPMGPHVLGRRPRHMGPIVAEFSANGLITPSVSTVKTRETFGGWGVNPAGANKVDSVLLTDDGDISYIFHNGGKGLDLDPIDYQSPLAGHTWAQGFRMNVDEIPDDAVITSLEVSATARAIGAGNVFGMYVYMKREGDPNPPLVNLFRSSISSAYTQIHPLAGSWTPTLTKKDLASAVFYVTDESTGPGFVRVTQLYVNVTYQIPVVVQVMSTKIKVPVQAGWNAPAVISALGAKINEIKELLEVEVSYPSPFTVRLRYRPLLDFSYDKETGRYDSGKVLSLKVLRSPTFFFALEAHGISGHPLGTDDGVDLWAKYDHPPVLTYSTDPDTGLRMPRTITPEVGFGGHSLSSTRMAGFKQITGAGPGDRSTSKFGTMSGYFPASIKVGVGSVINTPSHIFLEVPHSSAYYQDNDYIQFPDGVGGLVTVEIKVTNSFVPKKGTPLIVDLRPPIPFNAWTIIWDLVWSHTSAFPVSTIPHPTYMAVTLQVPQSLTSGTYEAVDGVDNSNFVIDNDSGRGRSQFTFPKYTFSPEDVAKILVVTNASFQDNIRSYTISQVVSDHVVACTQPVYVTDPSVLAKMIYKCQEPRPVRTKGPQALLLSESRLDLNLVFGGNEPQGQFVDAIGINDGVDIFKETIHAEYIAAITGSNFASFRNENDFVKLNTLSGWSGGTCAVRVRDNGIERWWAADNTSIIGWSLDGIAWNIINTGIDNIYCISKNTDALNPSPSGLMIAGCTPTSFTGGYHTMAYSTDGGATWNGLGHDTFAFRCDDIIWTGTVWVATGSQDYPGYAGADHSTLAYSADGINWTKIPTSGNIINAGKCLAMSGLLILVGGKAQPGSGMYSMAYTWDAAEPTNWAAVDVSDCFGGWGTVRGIEIDDRNSFFYAVGCDSSTNPVIARVQYDWRFGWTKVNQSVFATPGAIVTGIAINSDLRRLVAVAEGNAVGFGYSSDGFNWSPGSGTFQGHAITPRKRRM